LNIFKVFNALIFENIGIEIAKINSRLLISSALYGKGKARPMTGKGFVEKNKFVTRKIAGETIIVPVRAHVGELDSVYTLNELGTLIWDLLQDGKKEKEIARAIYETYEVSPEQAEVDVSEFLHSLAEAGLNPKNGDPVALDNPPRPKGASRQRPGRRP
jgi:hypothetical protein